MCTTIININILKNYLKNLSLLGKKNIIQKKSQITVETHVKSGKVTKELISNVSQQQTDEKITISKDGIKFENPNEVANILNDYFIDVGANITKMCSNKILDINNIFNTSATDIQKHLEVLNPVNPSEIEFTINSLKTQSAPGYDDISSQFIKSNINFFSVYLSNQINNYLMNAEFPNCLKIARIKPIYKSGQKHDVSNYRPISILPIISKIFESVLKTRLEQHLLYNDLIHKNQFGFVKQSSTTSACANLMNVVYTHINNSLKTAIIFVDLKKAFDCLDYNTLEVILFRYGIRNKALKLIMDYLQNRKQFVMVGSSLSEHKNIKCGIPQGSILGPLLFNIYINDVLNLKIHATSQLYADDCALIYGALSTDTLKYQMETDLQMLYSWFQKHNFVMNTNKTQFMIFNQRGKPQVNLECINIYGEKIMQTSSYDYLGLTIDNQLTWKDHIDKIQSKVSAYTGLCFRLRKIVNHNTLMTIYHAYIDSRITYCLTIWGTAADIYLNQIQTQQNQCLKIINYKPRSTRTITLYSSELLSFKQKIKYEMIYMIHKMRLHNHKTNFEFISNYQTSKYRTRRHEDIRPPQFLSNKSQKSLFYAGILYYNDVPKNIKDAAKVKVFKDLLKAYVFNKFDIK